MRRRIRIKKSSKLHRFLDKFFQRFDGVLTITIPITSDNSPVFVIIDGKRYELVDIASNEPITEIPPYLDWKLVYTKKDRDEDEELIFSYLNLSTNENKETKKEQKVE